MDQQEQMRMGSEERLDADSDEASSTATSMFPSEDSASSASDEEWNDDDDMPALLDPSDSEEIEVEAARRESTAVLGGPFDDERRSDAEVGQENDAVTNDAAPYPARPYFVAMKGTYHDLFNWMFPAERRRFDTREGTSTFRVTTGEGTTGQSLGSTDAFSARLSGLPLIQPAGHWHVVQTAKDV